LRAGDEVRSHFRRHRVVHLTFKDLKTPRWDACLEGIRGVVVREATLLG
jgi:hypothetical protein